MNDEIHSEPITSEMRFLAGIIGRSRAKLARLNDIYDAKIGPQDGVLADINGVLGELALAKWKNVYPNLSVGNPDCGFDSLVGRFRVDVKSTARKTGRLLAKLRDNPNVDCYVLALVLKDEVQFPGYVHKSELCQRANIDDLGHGKGYAMEQGRLVKWGWKWSPE